MLDRLGRRPRLLALRGASWAGPATPGPRWTCRRRPRRPGFPAANCLYCHVEKLPKKGAVTHNDRGKWLIAEKEKRKAKEIDFSWLKECPDNKTDEKKTDEKK